MKIQQIIGRERTFAEQFALYYEDKMADNMKTIKTKFRNMNTDGVETKPETGTHSPLPWTYFVGNANGRGLIRIEQEGTGVHVASMPRGSTSESNAAFIVRACNNADRLSEALKWIRDVVKERKGTSHWLQMVEDKSREALAQWEQQ